MPSDIGPPRVFGAIGGRGASEERASWTRHAVMVDAEVAPRARLPRPRSRTPRLTPILPMHPLCPSVPVVFPLYAPPRENYAGSEVLNRDFPGSQPVLHRRPRVLEVKMHEYVRIAIPWHLALWMAAPQHPSTPTLV